MKRKDLVVGLLLGMLVVYLFTQFATAKSLKETASYYEDNIAKQEEVLTLVAKTLGRGAATSDIASVIPDCPLDEMVAYDTLLASLDNGLTRAQLVELDQLFNYCGDVAANRRSGTALQLSYEVARYRVLLEGRALALGVKVEDTNIAKWEDLVKKEEQISQLFTSLVHSQDAIITTLLTGVAPTSINVENIRATAQKLREEMNVVVGEAAGLRAELVK